MSLQGTQNATATGKVLKQAADRSDQAAPPPRLLLQSPEYSQTFPKAAWSRSRLPSRRYTTVNGTMIAASAPQHRRNEQAILGKKAVGQRRDYGTRNRFGHRQPTDPTIQEMRRT
ncbi:MAG: hypothetical protein DI595_21910 [Agrobacterium fabrum]|uniref:Uncharacterized protein n=1 Tax=Agrobacterium fabrum TaxID=1176649 RepID=A0A2W5GL48_9HYPH|nr:MAG: hypothetical protein DI595_21910 [Agrobacterium fabrum]